MRKFDVKAENDPKRLNQWLNSHKLVLNIDRTLQPNVETTASLIRFQFNSSNVKIEPVCKILGVLVDTKLGFCSHTDLVKTKLNKQCGIVAKLRHYVPTTELLQYYKSNMNPSLQ